MKAKKKEKKSTFKTNLVFSDFFQSIKISSQCSEDMEK